MEKQLRKKKAIVRQNRTFRLSEYELQKLSEGAAAAGMNESKYVRELILHGGVDATHAEDRKNLIRQISLNSEDTKNLKSVEFSEAIDRLKKLVENGILTDEVAILFVSNYKLLKALNNLRNTIIHRGKRIMKYCELDDFFSQYVLPFVRDVLNCHYYRWHLNQLKSKGVYDSICKIIDEGKKATISYSKIAFQKELARCNLFVYKSNIQKGKEKEENIKRIIARRLSPHLDERYIKDAKCPCCDNKTIFSGRDVIGFDIDELGDETSTVGGFQIIHVPIYAEYTECGLCGFTYNDFIEIE